MTITAQGLRSGYGTFQLDGISLDIPQGQFTALIGPNGCGKSTLLKAFSGELGAGGGSVHVQGHDLEGTRPRQIARLISVLPQHPNVPEGVSVDQLVGYGRAPHQNLLGFRSPEDEKHIHEALETVGLGAARHALLSSLSGGQRQRAFIALCLAQDTPCILLDEPTSFLDIKYQYEILDLMRGLSTAGKTVIAVLHDIGQAARFADHLIVMKNGAVYAEGGPATVVTVDMLNTVYGLNAVVYDDPVSRSPVLSRI